MEVLDGFGHGSKCPPVGPPVVEAIRKFTQCPPVRVVLIPC